MCVRSSSPTASEPDAVHTIAHVFIAQMPATSSADTYMTAQGSEGEPLPMSGFLMNRVLSAKNVDPCEIATP